MASPTTGIAVEPVSQRKRSRSLPVWCAVWLASAAGLFAVVYLAALAVHAWQTSARYQSPLTAFGARLLDTEWKDIGEAIAAALCIVAGLAAPRFQWTWLRRVERAFTRFAAHSASRPAAGAGRAGPPGGG